MTRVAEPVPGDTIAGRYVIEHELGRGGFGVVYRARHMSMHREIALKVILATYARKDNTAEERFRREAILAASLRSPNTIALYDYGETEEGVFFIAMELLHGVSLTELIARERMLTPARTVHIIRQVLYALMEAHEKGIIHRDIKPENIMICPLAHDPNFVKVMDFGIAKMVAHGIDITQSGKSYGTPRYLPPEQLRGGKLSPATDVYAVGLVMYEMLTGNPAHTETDLARLLNEVARGPSVRLEPRGSLTAEICGVVNRAIAKDLSERYPSAVPFLRDLDMLANAYGLDGEGTERRAMISGQVIVGSSSGSNELAQTAMLNSQGTDISSAPTAALVSHGTQAIQKTMRNTREEVTATKEPLTITRRMLYIMVGLQVLALFMSGSSLIMLLWLMVAMLKK